MVILNNEQAARRAEQSTSNKPGMCQQWTRDLYNAPSVGDVDLDGDADAIDGWKKEHGRHAGDRTAPRGFPMTWSGGSKGHGHRAISLGQNRVRTIDGNGPGRVATVTMDFFEKNWNMKYIGWSETISGIAIPVVKIAIPKPSPPTKKSVQQIAKEVIDGKWGDGEERIRRLDRAGYDYNTVQAMVNRLLR